MKLVYIARHLLKQLPSVLACGLLTVSVTTTYAEEVPMSSIPAAPAPAAAVTITPAQAEATTPHKPSKRIWNLQDADILSVITEVSQETGKNFVVDPRVSGKISLVSSKPLRQQ